MYLVLTDALSCPRCGPEHGLIVLSDRMVDRRIIEGRLGCPNCHSTYPVKRGVADLRTDPTEIAAGAPPPLDAMELAALVGITGGPGFALLVGGTAELAEQLASIVPGLEWITLAPAFGTEPEQPGVNRILVNAGVPLRAHTVRGAIVLDERADLGEVVRALRPAARLVIASANDALVSELPALGLRIVARNAAMVVAERTS